MATAAGDTGPRPAGWHFAGEPRRKTCSICATSPTRSPCAPRFGRVPASPSSAAASSGWSSRRAPSSVSAPVTLIEAAPRLLMRGVPPRSPSGREPPRSRRRRIRAGTGIASDRTATAANTPSFSPMAARSRRRRHCRHRRRAGDRSGAGGGPADRQRHPRRQQAAHLATPTFSPPAIAAPSRIRSTMTVDPAGSLAQCAGAGEPWPPATCWARIWPMTPCPGSGRISMTRLADRRASR